jgi:hypothetical protein
MRMSWLDVRSVLHGSPGSVATAGHTQCGGTTMRARVLLLAVPHARQGECLQGEVGREGMIVGSADGSARGTDVSGSPLAGSLVMLPDKWPASTAQAVSSDRTLRRE